jgi:CRISPR/Cas system-associated exonuclease Cas4 (RecB family)
VSAVSNFLKCPKKYYYKNLLALREKRSFSADYGSIVHMIMEVFNKKHLNSYTKETILMLSDIIFDAKNNPDKALTCGFKARDIELIELSDDLKLLEMKGNFEEAAAELEDSGFFLSVPDKVLTEQSFEFTIPSLDGVVFDGRIDAIIEKNGEYSLWDYKTGKSKETPLCNMAVFEAKGGKEPQDMEEYLQKYDYQIPIYYFACKNAKTLVEVNGKVKELGLQYIRPIIKDGCQTDTVDAQTIAQMESKLFENLDTTVVQKIKSAKAFAPNYDDWSCANCAYAFLCDKDEEAYDD